MANRAHGLAAAPSSSNSVTTGTGRGSPASDATMPASGDTTSGLVASASPAPRRAAAAPWPRRPASSSATTATPTATALISTVASVAGARPRSPNAARNSGMPM